MDQIIEEKKRYHASYLRVSTNMQFSGMESQMRSIERYYKENDITNYKIFKDTAISGAKDSRPALDKMMEEIRSGNIIQVTTFSFSRISRSCSHLLRCLETMRSNKCSLVSLSEKIDTNTAIGQALVAVVGALSQLERDLIKERVLAGLARVRAEGRVLGRKKTRPSVLIRQLFIKGISSRESARIANTSTGSISKEILEMKLEMAKAQGIPKTQANRISIDRLREYFLDDPFKHQRKEKEEKKEEIPKKEDVNQIITHPELKDELPPLPPVIDERSPRHSARTSEIVTRGGDTTSVEIIK